MSAGKLCRARLPPDRTGRADRLSTQHKYTLNIKYARGAHFADQLADLSWDIESADASPALCPLKNPELVSESQDLEV